MHRGHQLVCFTDTQIELSAYKTTRSNNKEERASDASTSARAEQPTVPIEMTISSRTMPYILDWVREVRTKAGGFQSEARTDVHSVLEETAQGRLVLGLVLPAYSPGGAMHPAEKQDMHNADDEVEEEDEKEESDTGKESKIYASEGIYSGSSRTDLVPVSPTVPPLPSDDDSEGDRGERGRRSSSRSRSRSRRRDRPMLSSKDIVTDGIRAGSAEANALRWKRARALARQKLGGPRSLKDIEAATDALAPLYELEYESTEAEVGQTAYAVFNRMIVDIARDKEQQRRRPSVDQSVVPAHGGDNDEGALSLSEDSEDDGGGWTRRSPRRRPKTLETMTMRDVFAAFTKERLETVEKRRRRGGTRLEEVTVCGCWKEDVKDGVWDRHEKDVAKLWRVWLGERALAIKEEADKQERAMRRQEDEAEQKREREEVAKEEARRREDRERRRKRSRKNKRSLDEKFKHEIRSLEMQGPLKPLHHLWPHEGSGQVTLRIEKGIALELPSEKLVDRKRKKILISTGSVPVVSYRRFVSRDGHRVWQFLDAEIDHPYVKKKTESSRSSRERNNREKQRRRVMREQEKSRRRGMDSGRRRGQDRGDPDRGGESAGVMPTTLVSEREKYVSEDVIKFPCVMLTMNALHRVPLPLRPRRLPQSVIRRVVHRYASAMDSGGDSSGGESDVAAKRDDDVVSQVLCTFRTGFLERRTSRRRKNIIIAAGIADATRDFQLLNAVIRTYQRGLQAARDADRDYYMSAATKAVYGGAKGGGGGGAAAAAAAHRHANSTWGGDGAGGGGGSRKLVLLSQQERLQAFVVGGGGSFGRAAAGVGAAAFPTRAELSSLVAYPNVKYELSLDDTDLIDRSLRGEGASAQNPGVPVVKLKPVTKSRGKKKSGGVTGGVGGSGSISRRKDASRSRHHGDSSFDFLLSSDDDSDDSDGSGGRRSRSRNDDSADFPSDGESAFGGRGARSSSRLTTKGGAANGAAGVSAAGTAAGGAAGGPAAHHKKAFLLEPKINTPFGMDVGVGQLLHLVGVIDPSVLRETLPLVVHDTLLRAGSSIVIAAAQASASYDRAKHIREELSRRERGALEGGEEDGV